jgi:predicted NUDIX family NTP pyrophosphohydrolase
MYRRINGILEILIVHSGGPFFKNKDLGHWSIPKGEPDENEDLLLTAIREFEEETGFKPEGEFISLGSITQKGGKEVFAWAVEGDMPLEHVHTSNFVELEWPPRSGKLIRFPEVDKIEFCDLIKARQKIKEAQIPLIERLEKYLEEN